MKRALLCVALAGCTTSDLRSEALPEIGPPEYGRVAASRPLSIRSGETRAERAAWAVMSLNPIVVAGAVLGLEDEFGRSQLSEYDIALNDGTAATVRSRYVAQPGQCVMMRRALHTDQVILIGQDASLCTPPP